MFETWKKVLDKGGYICPIFMGLSKASDTLNHGLLIAKLSIWVWNRRSEIHEDLFNNQKAKVTVNKTFSEWERITTGIPQGSIIGPLLFNIFLNDLCLFISNSSLSNYADDNTLYPLSEIIWKRSRIIYETVLIRCINGFTNIICRKMSFYVSRE